MKVNKANNKFPDSRTKERLLESALIEFSRNGYFNTNIDTITKSAGVSHGTFYLYFNNKHTVLINLVQRIRNEIAVSIKTNDTLNQKISTENIDDFEQSINYIIEIIIKSSGLFRAFIQGMVQNTELFDMFDQIARDLAYFFTSKLYASRKKNKIQGYDKKIISQIMAVALLMSIFIQIIDIIKCAPLTLSKNLSYIFFTIMNFDKKMMKTVKPGTAANKKISNKTRMDLLDMAKQEFAQFGYFDTKVANIAEKAGYSRGTFYQYFKDKDDVIQAIFQDMFSRFSNTDNILDVMIDKVDPASFDDLAEISSTVVDIFENYFHVNRALLQGAYFSRKIGDNYRLIFDRFSEPIVRKINELKEDGKCRGVDSLIAAQIILTTASYSAFMYQAGLIKSSKDEFALNFGHFLFNFLNFTHG